MGNSLLVAELVCARLCDDLGVLLASMKGSLDVASEQTNEGALATARVASDGLTRRVALMRCAWANNQTRLSVKRLGELADALPGAHRLRTDLSGFPSRTVFPASMGRVVLNVMFLASESLPRGGTITLSPHQGDDILIAIAGTHAAWPAGFAEMLSDPESAWSSLENGGRLIPSLVALISIRFGIRVSLLPPDGTKRRGKPAAKLLVSAGSIRE